MTTAEFEEIERQFEVEDIEESRPQDLRFKPRKRPDYFKRRPPVRQGMSLRSNYRVTRV